MGNGLMPMVCDINNWILSMSKGYIIRARDIGQCGTKREYYKLRDNIQLFEINNIINEKLYISEQH